MAKYADKWKNTFPESIGNQTRPSDGVDNTQVYNTDALPQYMANDPVRYDLQNAINSQLVSNDERLNEKIGRTSDDLAAHNKDPKAHAAGISGNAASATIADLAKAVAWENVSGKPNNFVDTDSTQTITGAKTLTNNTIITTTNDDNYLIPLAVQAPYLSEGHGIYINLGKEASLYNRYSFGFHYQGNNDPNNYFSFSSYSGPSYNFDCAGNATFPTSLTVPKVNAGSSVWTKSITVADASYVPTAKDGDSSNTIASTEFVTNNSPRKDGTGASGTWDINISGTATKLQSPRKINITGDATGEATFDGSTDISISSTVNASKHATAADNDGNGDNIANTYLKKATVIDVIYPIGSIYMSMSATNPHDLFGVGTWERISQGRMLLGADDSTYKAGATGGEATHTLTAAEMPAHSHSGATSWNGNHYHGTWGEKTDNNNSPFGFYNGNKNHSGSAGGMDGDNPLFKTSADGNHNHTFTTNNSGGGAAHNNMSPYLVCYIWQRTA